MGAPDSGFEAADQGAVESLLSSFKTIDPSERRKHATVINYWLSIRGNREFPPLHDLDPLELSDAGPNSILLELIGGGHDAEIRHIGEALKGEVSEERLVDAPNPSLLSLISKKLPIVALSRDFLAFEDHYSTPEGVCRYWVTLLPLSACGNWVDYVYALVSFKAPSRVEAPTDEVAPADAVAEEPADPTEAIVEAPVDEVSSDEVDETVGPVSDEAVEETDVLSTEVNEAEPETESASTEIDETDGVEEEIQQLAEAVAVEIEPELAESETAESETTEFDPAEFDPAQAEPASDATGAPGFSKLFDTLAGLAGFYGQGVKVEPHMSAPAAPEQEEEIEASTGEAEPPADEQFAPEEQPAAEEALAGEVAPTEEEPLAEEPAMSEIEPEADEQPAAAAAFEIPAEQQAEPATPAMEGSLQSKLSEVRAKADEARQAKLRANAALYEGLSAAYDFALDAEDSPEEYLRLVESQGLKIQLRSPMKPVVKLAFDGMCDDATVKQLEAVLAWAFAEELPRGSLAERIEAAGGIAYVLNGEAKPS